MVQKFPWLAHGHIFPFLEPAKRLSRRNFTIYLCSTSVNLDSIKNSKKKDSFYDDIFIKLVELHIPSLVELPPRFHTDKNLPFNLLPSLLKAFQMSSSSFSNILSSINPDLLIYDMVQLTWSKLRAYTRKKFGILNLINVELEECVRIVCLAPKIASSKGIPSIYFATLGAVLFSFYHHVHMMGDGLTFPYPAIYLLDREIMLPYLKDADDDFALGNLKMSCEIVLMKSLVPTGPLIVDSNDYDHEEFSKIMKLLSGKSRYSTVYISFGSEYFLSKKQIVEIAKALELCGVNFIWVVRFPGDEKMIGIECAFLIEFLERVQMKGLIVPGVSGFISHCGWSSVMKSMYFGVPIKAMPIKSEQPINARLVVEAGVGVEVERESGGLYVREKIAKAINKVIVEKEFCEDTRNRTKKLSEKIKEKEKQDMNETTMDLLKICMKNKLQGAKSSSKGGRGGGGK
ncbi:UDP-glucuronosyl and UDP-glucosyl transferase [Handroanthus impetiginosus]|uniref:UDP-glucuronosyl and UDP-glucosyl transferase n=1 Tax=Handroanthus impetiginosus TaxID=429701 RepID=A0A2G9G2I5_9LAMI|nr:UDP-glucuronosyl and UDP-glucosyl transferase [Handroanthus impetiginosus]